jgi:hypothetical protein
MIAKRILLATTSVIILFSSTSANADFAEALECHKKPNEKTCSAVLIGHIDSLYSFEKYCPDGKTSYEFLQQAWAREVSKDENLLKLGTSLSMLITISKLNLACKK